LKSPISHRSLTDHRFTSLVSDSDLLLPSSVVIVVSVMVKTTSAGRPVSMIPRAFGLKVRSNMAVPIARRGSTQVEHHSDIELIDIRLSPKPERYLVSELPRVFPVVCPSEKSQSPMVPCTCLTSLNLAQSVRRQRPNTCGLLYSNGSRKIGTDSLISVILSSVASPPARSTVL
jgi:hypothetical protein